MHIHRRFVSVWLTRVSQRTKHNQSKSHPQGINQYQLNSLFLISLFGFLFLITLWISLSHHSLDISFSSLFGYLFLITLWLSLFHHSLVISFSSLFGYLFLITLWISLSHHCTLWLSLSLALILFLITPWLSHSPLSFSLGLHVSIFLHLIIDEKGGKFYFHAPIEGLFA